MTNDEIKNELLKRNKKIRSAIDRLTLLDSALPSIWVGSSILTIMLILSIGILIIFSFPPSIVILPYVYLAGLSLSAVIAPLFCLMLANKVFSPMLRSLKEKTKKNLLYCLS